MAARKTTRRALTEPAAPPAPDPCPVCKGAGEVANTVRVGRRHRVVGQQSGFCLACFGTGEAPAT
ncbi:hypothetical protein NGB36_12030 [Streptomyces sp. RB6PN25]|uniref:Small CPxCG-related zinc finger protein n=1 Tax=Streptomyces humicola TaxID=2953240 RepID=A0ABT1PUG6_9ACTN|nr:hypothetical protein [Streptomyces humicola]MCQ4081309.1 hypothetical protein [Streptomyces humicola]